MKLEDLLDTKLLDIYLRDRIVNEARHPEHRNLAIYNYGHVAQHENIWDNVTEHCRGLIVDTSTGDILARPFRKFFNLNTSFRPETHEQNLPNTPPRVLEKLDGSLGILYRYNNIPLIATRGSFASDQAKWATTWYLKQVSANTCWPKGYTPLFEIIYKENRIVVNYDFEGLVLLGLVSIDTGFELSPEEVASWASQNGLRVAQEYGKTLEECQADTSPNTEGFVVQYWSNKAPIPLRLKIKTEDYVRLHKVITGLNAKGIWEHLSQGFAPEALYMPASQNKPFVDWCTHWIGVFQKMYASLEQLATEAFGRASIKARADIARQQIINQGIPLDARATRKYYALAFQEESPKVTGALWDMYDGKPYQLNLWKQIKPSIQDKEVFIRDADSFEGI